MTSEDIAAIGFVVFFSVLIGAIYLYSGTLHLNV
jgi:hypothetical protein